MGKIMNAIDRQIIRPKAIASEQQGFQKTDEHMRDFHSQGNPNSYVWTHKIEETANHSGVSGNNGNYDYSIWLERPTYYTGTPAFPVLEKAQNNGAGILGKPNTWEDSMKDIEKSLKENFQ